MNAIWSSALLLSGVLTAAIVAPIRVPAAEPGDRRVHIVLAADTHDHDIGDQIAASRKHLGVFFRKIPSYADEHMHVLEAEELSPDAIIGTIEGLDVGPGDAIIYYHLGHGAFDDNHADDDPSHGHFFDHVGGKGDLLRRDVRKRLLEKGAGLTVILSDTCNIHGHANIHPVEAGAPKGFGPDKVLRDLIHGHDGLIDVNGASRNQFGWYSPNTGGWFTENLIKGIHSRALTARDFVSWDDYLAQVESDLERYYRMWRSDLLKRPANLTTETSRRLEAQTDQTPAVFVKKLALIRR